jgi:hypothetical protein
MILSILFTLFASAGNTFFPPASSDPSQLVKIEVLMKDASDSAGPQLTRVEFNGRRIPLKPRDIQGNRGSGSFQVRPGKYLLRWTVNRDNFAWPRHVDHEEEVTISNRDLWLQLEIQGDKATIS